MSRGDLEAIEGSIASLVEENAPALVDQSQNYPSDNRHSVPSDEVTRGHTTDRRKTGNSVNRRYGRWSAASGALNIKRAANGGSNAAAERDMKLPLRKRPRRHHLGFSLRSISG